jgi:hypothetical protein
MSKDLKKYKREYVAEKVNNAIMFLGQDEVVKSGVYKDGLYIDTSLISEEGFNELINTHLDKELSFELSNDFINDFIENEIFENPFV